MPFNSVNCLVSRYVLKAFIPFTVFLYSKTIFLISSMYFFQFFIKSSLSIYLKIWEQEEWWGITTAHYICDTCCGCTTACLIQVRVSEFGLVVVRSPLSLSRRQPGSVISRPSQFKPEFVLRVVRGLFSLGEACWSIKRFAVSGMLDGHSSRLVQS